MKKTIIFISLVLLVFGVIIVRSVPASSTSSTVNNPTQVDTAVATKQSEVTPTKNKNEVQVIKATYDNESGMTPKKFTVKAGLPVRLEVLAKEDGLGCMGSIMLPELSEDIQGFEEGKTNIFEITPSTPGEYLISCAMGIPHGFIIAI